MTGIIRKASHHKGAKIHLTDTKVATVQIIEEIAHVGAVVEVDQNAIQVETIANNQKRVN